MKNDIKFVVFSEIYQRHSAPKSKREALSILSSAIELFGKKGFNTTTMSMIAKHYGTSTTKVSYYFGTLPELQTSAIKYTRYLFQSYVVDEMSKKKTSLEMFNCYFTCCITWPRYFESHTRLWISFLHLCTLKEELRAINTQAVDVGFLRLVELIQLGQESGQFICKDERKVAKLIQTLVTGLLLANASEGNKSDKINEDKSNQIDTSELVRRQCLELLLPVGT